MTRPACGYFDAILFTLWVVLGYASILLKIETWTWLDYAVLPINTWVHYLIIKLIWRP